jgi:hypothetical protein
MRNEHEEGEDRNVLQEEQKAAQRMLIQPSAGETPRSPAIEPTLLSPHVTKKKDLEILQFMCLRIEPSDDPVVQFF